MMTRADRERAARFFGSLGIVVIQRWIESGEREFPISDRHYALAAEFAAVREEGMRAGFQIAQDHAIPWEADHSGALHICWDDAETELEKAVKR